MAKIESEFDSQTSHSASYSEDLGEGREGNRSTWLFRIAAGFILLLAGFAAGQFMDGDGEEFASTRQVAALEQDVQQMQKLLVNSQTQ